jgi:hypothetical protein
MVCTSIGEDMGAGGGDVEESAGSALGRESFAPRESLPATVFTVGPSY